jgi:hypothetical protein
MTLESSILLVEYNSNTKTLCVVFKELALVDDPLVCQIVGSDPCKPFLMVSELIPEIFSPNKASAHLKETKKNRDL